MKQIGKLEKVEPRIIWQDEERNFTPWLKENIHYLSEAIGIDIEINESESQVGNFWVDLIGKDINNGQLIVIENQLSPTNHDHLGKLLTYSAGKDARVVIWITTDFRDEHRQALEWLNNISGEDRFFFGVQLGVLKIGDSLPAPNFDIVVQPSDWMKIQGASAKPTQRQLAYQSYFTKLLDDIKKKIPGSTAAKKVSYTNWFSFPSKKPGFLFSISFADHARVRVELYIDMGNIEKNKKYFDALYADKEKIEEEIGQEISWERLDTKRACRIAVYRDGKIDDSEENLKEYRDWSINMLSFFIKTFNPRLAQLT